MNVLVFTSSYLWCLTCVSGQGFQDGRYYDSNAKLNEQNNRYYDQNGRYYDSRYSNTPYPNSPYNANPYEIGYQTYVFNDRRYGQQPNTYNNVGGRPGDVRFVGQDPRFSYDQVRKS